MYIHQLSEWPHFTRRDDRLIAPLARVRQLHGRLLGKLDVLGFAPLEETSLDTLTQDVIRSTEIEGERLDARQVRSSVARRLGVKVAQPVAATREVEGMVDLTLDAILHCKKPLTRKRLLDWQAALFPEGRSGLYRIRTGKWRDDAKGPMQVVSGGLGRERIRTGKWRDDSKGPMQVVSGGWGRERVHFQAPEADRIPAEMRRFLTWLEEPGQDDPILKAATAHLWFLTIHPFDDGNGRIARALTDLLLSRMDTKGARFYSLSAAIMAERDGYYKVLESTQSGDLDITDWLLWFVGCLERAMDRAATTMDKVLQKHLFWQRHGSLDLNLRHRKILALLLEGFEGNLTSGKWAKIARCSTDTALRDIQFLTEQGILVRGEAGGRSTGYHLA